MLHLVVLASNGFSCLKEAGINAPVVDKSLIPFGCRGALPCVYVCVCPCARYNWSGLCRIGFYTRLPLSLFTIVVGCAVCCGLQILRRPAFSCVCCSRTSV